MVLAALDHCRWDDCFDLLRNEAQLEALIATATIPPIANRAELEHIS